MIYARILLTAFITLAATYYIMVVGHLFGLWKLTQRRITFVKLCVPFYYWMVSQKVNKPTPKTNQQND